MAGAHDTGFGHGEAQDQVVSPQGHVAVPAAGGAGLLCIHWVTDESVQTQGNTANIIYLSPSCGCSQGISWENSN